jgi:hypothetical protein
MNLELVNLALGSGSVSFTDLTCSFPSPTGSTRALPRNMAVFHLPYSLILSTLGLRIFCHVSVIPGTFPAATLLDSRLIR